MKNNTLIICLIAVLFFTANTAWSDSYHSIIYETAPVESTIINTETANGVVLGIAASQHHYKATTSLQWSVGAGYIDDDSAVSFGLGLQSGKVFISGNFSSDGSSSAIGFGASGTF